MNPKAFAYQWFGHTHTHTPTQQASTSGAVKRTHAHKCDRAPERVCVFDVLICVRVCVCVCCLPECLVYLCTCVRVCVCALSCSRLTACSHIQVKMMITTAAAAVGLVMCTCTCVMCDEVTGTQMPHATCLAQAHTYILEVTHTHTHIRSQAEVYRRASDDVNILPQWVTKVYANQCKI